MTDKKFRYEYFIFLLAILLCYFNIIKSPQIYYDDYSNVFSPALLGKGFNIKWLLNSLKFHIGGVRPLAYLSFYLNNYLFWGSIRSFVIINVIIHFLNTVIFYHIGLNLTKNEKLSFFAALFWAVNPVNIFAVSYIVQRMTSLMAFFGGLATLYYLKWEKTKQNKYLGYAMLLVILASLSKENGILFLGFFILHYYIKNGTKKDIMKIIAIGFLFLVFLYFLSVNLFTVQFINRNFTPYGRFLTELRVLVFYIQNILLPFEKNIFLIIDFNVSKGLLHPISTLLSGLFLIFLIIVAIFYSEKDKVISLGILSFFLFHIVESTFIPLYLAFFHRNYIASFFLILAFLKFLFSFRNKITDFLIVALILNSMWVSVLHNLKWYYKPYYIQKNYESYPNSIVAKTQYAIALQKEGKLDKALKLYLELLHSHKRTIPFISLVEIFHIKGLNKEALALANIYPHKDPELTRIMALCYVNLHQFNKATKLFEKYLSENFSPSVLFDYLSLLYESSLFDKVVFAAGKYQKELLFNLTRNKAISQIYNIDNILTKILLLKIECEIRLNMVNTISKDIDFLKKHNLFNNQVKTYIEALTLLKSKNYQQALKKLNSLNFEKLGDVSFFLLIKKWTFTLCIYEKTGQRKEFQKLIEKISKNTIIYSNIWRGLDKCY